MKRWKATQLRFNEADLIEFTDIWNQYVLDYKDTAEYKDAVKLVDDAQKALDKDVENETLQLALETAQTALQVLDEAKPKMFCEDSVLECPQLGERVLFVDQTFIDLSLLGKDLIKLGVPFYFDTGTEWVLITEDNYKDYDKTKIVKVKDDKYKEIEI